MKKLIQLSILCLLITAVLISCKKSDPEPDVLKILGLTEKVGNVGYKELSEAKAKLFLTMANDNKNPFNDEKGDLSQTAKQPLAGFTILPSNLGGKSTRTLTIPASNYVFLSPLGATIWYYENDKCDPDWKPKTGQTLKDFLYQELATFVNHEKATASVVLDGVELMPDKTKFRRKSDVFDLVIHPDYNNPACDYSKQTAKTISDSFEILLKLPKGKHVLVMKGIFPDPDPANVFEAIVTWNLTVE